MYQTMWIDIQSGKEDETFEAVKQKVKRFKSERGFGYAEVGMVFEEFDVFAVFELADTEVLTRWILEEIAPLEGAVEIKMGRFAMVDRPLRPLESKPLTIRRAAGGEEKVFNLPKGHSFLLIYLDALPAKYPAIYKALGQLDDTALRYRAYCLDSYEEDMVVCLVMEDFEKARSHIVDKIRQLDGMKDTRTYVVNNVEFL